MDGMDGMDGFFFVHLIHPVHTVHIKRRSPTRNPGPTLALKPEMRHAGLSEEMNILSELPSDLQYTGDFCA